VARKQIGLIMKTKNFRFIVAGIALIAVIAFSVRAKTAKERSLVVHEWGTFTSLQGGDGQLIYWKPLQTSELPDFVHSWNNPGPGLPAVLGLGKGGMVAMQRLETPVIYFYNDEKNPTKHVDVSVKFPNGRITEWYPEATSIGPNAGVINRLMNSYTNAGYIDWTGITLMPSDSKRKLASDSSGSHYFAARDTDANPLSSAKGPYNSHVEFEKFLFYRGVGNFKTPLLVTMNSDDAVTISNTGTEPLAHLFVLGIKDKAGNFITVDELKPGDQKTVPIETKTLSAPELTKKISDSLAQALVKAGLYPREAAAMVETWKDSWFAEEGLRVLYILPRAWTDRTLPMDLKPAPRELARVMVGRAEILSPQIEQSLTMDLEKARQGDSAAAADARNTLHSLGRFAGPAFFRAMPSAQLPPEESERLTALLSDAAKNN